MKLRLTILFFVLIAGCALAESASDDRIAWFGTWEGGLAEAQRTGKPIMLVSAAPYCHTVPGVW